ncbi:MAG TPA: hypothetical protein VFE17_04505, partial [Candidatus Baltobacteraceae bacterium]|nr:hypothetical protein [Candidatus Baltobacteraceae bacterium]
MDQDVSGELPDDAARASLPQAIYEFGTSVAVDLQLVSMGWLAAHPAWRYTSIGQSYVTALLDGPPLSALGRDYQNVAPALNQVLNDMLKDDVPGVRMTAGVKSLLLHAARDQALRVRLMYLSRAFSPDVLLSPGFEESGLITAGAVLHLSSRKVSIFDVMTVLWPTVPDKTLLALSRSPRFDDSFARMNERGAKAAHEILNDAR